MITPGSSGGDRGLVEGDAVADQLDGAGGAGEHGGESFEVGGLGFHWVPFWLV